MAPDRRDTPVGGLVSKSAQTDVPGDVDVVIIGGGIAGLSVALTLPPDLRILVATKGALGESNTRYAQGGLAAAVGLDDSPALHLRDTVTAGAGLVDEAAARALVEEAGDAVAWLIAAGTHFDGSDTVGAQSMPPNGGRNGTSLPSTADDLATSYDLTREAAHSRRRVLHAHDATGAEIERALVDALRTRGNAIILESTTALDLLAENDDCTGVEFLRGQHRFSVCARRGVVLANGGAGRLWQQTTNPTGATADGLALAWRAGAALADLEFVQFHPTVLIPPRGEPFLISEAVRGEGAQLRNAAGERFMSRYSPEAELAPRDVVARAILNEMLAADAPCVYLDLRHLPAEETHARFPTISAVCRAYGLDLAHDLIPVAPAAHYFMGGVAVDIWARTTVPNLYAVGEVACTGVHGANRLASNSLLEGLVFGRRAAQLISGTIGSAEPWPRTPALSGTGLADAKIAQPLRDVSAPIAQETRGALRRIMWRNVSLRRDARGLRSAADELRALAERGPVDPETANMLFAAQAITAAALDREESRGGHYREDFPTRDAALDGRHTLLAANPPTSGTLARHRQEVAHA